MKSDFKKKRNPLLIVSFVILAVLLLGITGIVALVVSGVNDLSSVEPVEVQIPLDNKVLRE